MQMSACLKEQMREVIYFALFAWFACAELLAESPRLQQAKHATSANARKQMQFSKQTFS